MSRFSGHPSNTAMLCIQELLSSIATAPRIWGESVLMILTYRDMSSQQGFRLRLHPFQYESFVRFFNCYVRVISSYCFRAHSPARF